MVIYKNLVKENILKFVYVFIFFIFIVDIVMNKKNFKMF